MNLDGRAGNLDSVIHTQVIDDHSKPIFQFRVIWHNFYAPIPGAHLPCQWPVE